MSCLERPQHNARERLHRKAVRVCLLVAWFDLIFLIYLSLPSDLANAKVDLHNSHHPHHHLHHRHHHTGRCPSLIINWAKLATIRFDTQAILRDYQTRFLNKELNEIDTANQSLSGHGDVTHPRTPRLPSCPLIPAHLEGEITLTGETIQPETLMALWPQLEAGGRLRPLNCSARERLAVIIPFKDRHQHLHVLLKILIKLLHSQQADVTFFIIEQASPSLFNRGTLFNIGFLEANKLGQFDCFIFHDVDLVPMKDNILYRCTENPRHFAVAVRRYGQREAHVLYRDHYGGIVGFTKRQYLDVNGHSNLYFGWGGEDDDLYSRVVYKGYKKVRDDPSIFQYQMLKHTRNDRRRGNVDRMLLLRTSQDRQDEEGLSSTVYQVISSRQERLYTWITVSFNMTQLILAAPDYTLLSIKSLLELSKTES